MGRTTIKKYKELAYDTKALLKQRREKIKEDMDKYGEKMVENSIENRKAIGREKELKSLVRNQ